MYIYICTRDRSVTAFLGSLRKWDLKGERDRKKKKKREREEGLSSSGFSTFSAHSVFFRFALQPRVLNVLDVLDVSTRRPPSEKQHERFVCRLRLKAADRLAEPLVRVRGCSSGYRDPDDRREARRSRRIDAKRQEGNEQAN